MAVEIALLLLPAATSAVAVGSFKTAGFARVRASSPSLVVQDFVSEGAKKQIGNDAFLNEDLMGRAIRGPGVVSDSKLKIGVVGAGLAGMVAAMDLADAGHDVEMFELRPYVGGKVSSWLDGDGNHIEMGLHVFFGCYYNLFGIMKRTGSFDECALPPQPALTRVDRAPPHSLPHLHLSITTPNSLPPSHHHHAPSRALP